VAGLLGDTLYLVQVGDSRAYLVRDGVAEQLTKDQSLMQRLVEAGELTEEEASQSERRNIILQALGPEPTIKVDLTYQRIRRGDTLVLCSDGLSGQVPREEIARVITEEQDLVVACRRLIDMANNAGGPDNITVIVARFLGEGLNEMGEGDDVGHRVFALADGNTPPVGIERMIDDDPTLPIRTSSDRTTAPSPMIRTSLPLPNAQSTGSGGAESGPLPGPVPGDDIHISHDDPTLRMIKAAQPQRRSRGMAIAVALLALMIVFAAWFAIRTVRKVQPDPTPANPAAPSP
jgi:protein phosphatase